MTIDTFTPPAPVTIAGTGPYGFNQPYAAGALQAWVLTGTTLTVLVAGADFTVSPEASDTGGNVILSPAAATTHAGRQLILIRDSAPEQGWQAVQAGREAGLEAQLDAMAMALQDLRQAVQRSVRLPASAAPLVPEAGRTIAFDANGNPVPGPTVTDIEAAVTAAATAQAAAALAQAAAAIAQAAEASLIRDAGNWATATAYRPSDLVTQSGSTYVCQIAHTSGAFSTDLSAGRWRVFAAQGATGTGSGNVVAANNGSEFTDKALFRTNVGVGAEADVQHRSLLLAGTAPVLTLREADGNTGWNSSRWRQEAGVLELQSLSQAGVVLSTDLRLEKDAGGAGRIVFLMNGAELLVLQDGVVQVLGSFRATNQVGELFWWEDEDPPPHGLQLDGAAVSRTTYADLFARWGTRFGVGNGTTTFNIADARGYGLRAWDDGRGIDPGRALGTFQNDAFQGHYHSVRTGNGGDGSGDRVSRGSATSNFTLHTASVTGPVTDGVNGTPRIAAETRGKNLSAMLCVRI